MDAHGVDMQVLSLTSGVEVITDPAGVAVARKVNDYLAEVVAAHPPGLPGSRPCHCRIPMPPWSSCAGLWWISDSRVLHNDHVLGHYLDEPQFRPVWAELERLGVTHLHPAIVPERLRVFEGHPVLAGRLGDGRQRSAPTRSG